MKHISECINEYFKIMEGIMIGIGNDEPCPFCKGKEKFINNPDVDFLEHIMREHPVEMNDFLFGNESIGI